MPRRLLLGCLFLLLASPVVAPADSPDKPWKGQLVIGKKPAKEIAFGDDAPGRQSYFAFQGIYPIQVREDRNGRLRIFDGHREGWVSKDDFVLSRDAPTYFSERITTNPKDTFAWYWRGVGRVGRDEFDQAIEDFSEAIRLDPKHALAFCGRGVTWAAKKEYDKAIKDYDTAIRLDPRYALAFNNRGIARAAKGEYDKAIKDYDTAIRLDPRSAGVLHNRGVARAARKEYDKAVKDYDTVIRFDPGFALAYRDRGNAWSARKKYAEAARDYDEAVRLDPENADFLNARAWLRATCPDGRWRDGGKAVGDAKRACVLTDDKDPGCLDTLAAAHAEAGDFDQAVSLQKRVLADQSLGEKARAEGEDRLKLYETKKPYREEK